MRVDIEISYVAGNSAIEKDPFAHERILKQVVSDLTKYFSRDRADYVGTIKGPFGPNQTIGKWSIVIRQT